MLFKFIYTQDNKVVTPTCKEELRYFTFYNYLKKLEGSINEEKDNVTTFSGSFLNQFFEGEINSFFTNAKDLSVENYFLTTDTDNGILTIGASIDFRDIPDLFRKKKSLTKDFNRLKHLATIYINSNVKNNFATISSKNAETDKFEFNSGIGIGFKYTQIQKGTIRFNKSDGFKFRRLRETLIQKKINEDIDSYNKKEFPDVLSTKILDAKIAHLKTRKTDFSSSKLNLESENFKDANILEQELEKEIVKKKYYEFLQKIIDEELLLVKKEKLYNGFNTWWWGGEFFWPITTESVNIAPNDSTSFTAENFRDWKLNGNLNYLVGMSDNTIFNFGVIGSIFNNNNFIAQNISSKSFQNIDSSTNDFQVLGTSNKVFVGNYEEFISISIKAEAGFLYKSTVGLSGSLERTFDKFDNTNWKLAIPFSLKDKDDKPTVNFEIQWRETFGEHVVGVGVGYVFGRYVK